MEIDFSGFSISPLINYVCIPTFTYSSTLVDSSALPNFMSVDMNYPILSINSIDYSD